jgi:transglutaminase-like putative cysteine protease
MPAPRPIIPLPEETVPMRIRCGYRIAYECAQPVPMLLALSLHPSRAKDLLTPVDIHFTPALDAHHYTDDFGNVCHRILAPQGRVEMFTQFDVEDSGLPDKVEPGATQFDVQALPDGALVYLLGSRYCETDRLSNIAWSLFGGTPPGWARVEAICSFVHERITFGYEHARPDKTAWDGYNERQGVCRDFAHLAVALCRCMNIPARYCTGYLGDIGVPPADSAMDFSAWFEAYLNGPDGGRWYTFDARHNVPRIGRVLMARGRDATDVALATIFGPAWLSLFEVVTDEIKSG